MQFIRISDNRRCNYFPVILAVFWLTGLFAGFLTPTSNLATNFENALSIASDPLTIAGIFIAVFLPFVVCLAAGLIGNRPLIWIGAFFSSFFLGYTLSLIRYGFGSAGWLLCLLLMFSRIISSPMLLWFSLICTERSKKVALRKALVLFSVLTIISTFDYLIISPFLIFVMKHV